MELLLGLYIYSWWLYYYTYKYSPSLFLLQMPDSDCCFIHSGIFPPVTECLLCYSYFQVIISAKLMLNVICLRSYNIHFLRWLKMDAVGYLSALLTSQKLLTLKQLLLVTCFSGIFSFGILYLTGAPSFIFLINEQIIFVILTWVSL